MGHCHRRGIDESTSIQIEPKRKRVHQRFTLNFFLWKDHISLFRSFRLSPPFLSEVCLRTKQHNTKLFFWGGSSSETAIVPGAPPQSWPRPDSAILVWSPGVGGGAEGYKICCDKTGMKNIDHICTPFLRNSAEDSRFSHNFITFIENVYAIVMSKFSFSALCAGEKPVSLMSFNVKANICPF